MSGFKCYNPDDVSYLKGRREWSRRPTLEVGATGPKKSDLEICGLPHLFRPDVLRDQEDAVSCDVTSAAAYPEMQVLPELGPRPLDQRHADYITVQRPSVSCCDDPEAEQSRQITPPTPFVDGEQRKMAESESSSQTGKASTNKEYTASKLFNSLGFSKIQDTGKHTSSSNSKDRSVKTTQVTIFYAPIPQPDSSRHEGHYSTPRTSPVASSDEPPDQSLMAKQHRLIRRLHSTLNEATTIVGDILILFKRDE